MRWGTIFLSLFLVVGVCAAAFLAILGVIVFFGQRPGANRTLWAWMIIASAALVYLAGLLWFCYLIEADWLDTLIPGIAGVTWLIWSLRRDWNSLLTAKESP